MKPATETLTKLIESAELLEMIEEMIGSSHTMISQKTAGKGIRITLKNVKNAIITAHNEIESLILALPKSGNNTELAFTGIQTETRDEERYQKGSTDEEAMTVDNPEYISSLSPRDQFKTNFAGNALTGSSFIKNDLLSESGEGFESIQSLKRKSEFRDALEKIVNKQM
jgi:Ulp1 family protease